MCHAIHERKERFSDWIPHSGVTSLCNGYSCGSGLLFGEARPPKPGLSEFLADVSRQAGGRGEEEPLRIPLGAAEGEHVQERARLRVEGEVPDPTRLPIVLDEAEDGA